MSPAAVRFRTLTLSLPILETSSFVILIPATQSKKSSEIQAGWTVGGGLEGMVGPNWLARIEYRYSDLGNFSFTALQFNINAHGADARLSTTSHIVNVGLAYKW